ncbi:MAG: DNRLRE domain-containing protein [Deltaproteobacteria bacterium]|nr:DNRLRE domain-containing protein [Deltaproteobacteria bacterium]
MKWSSLLLLGCLQLGSFQLGCHWVVPYVAEDGGRAPQEASASRDEGAQLRDGPPPPADSGRARDASTGEGGPCRLPHATSSPSCGIAACEAGWGDCDGLAANGCETQLAWSLPPTDDTHLSHDNPSLNFGASPALQSTLTYRALLRFDSRALPPRASVARAALTLTLRSHEAVEGASYAFSVHEVTEANAAWVEGTGVGRTAGAGEPCFDYLDCGRRVPWAGAAGLEKEGVDYIEGPFATVILVARTGLTHRWDVFPALVERWRLPGGKNAGVVLFPRTGFHFWFHSKEAAPGSQPPRLEVTLECRP